MIGRPPRLRLPEGKRFAFTIFDDCDNSTVANTKPFYDLLERLGMRTTKTVWAFDEPDVPRTWRGSQTLENPAYRAYACALQASGAEIASHGASMVSSTRARSQRALEVFEETFGRYPRSYANHGSNRENVYWLGSRFRSRLLRALNGGISRAARRSEGHRPGSPYFWGDLCLKHMDYVRGFTFPVLNLLAVHRNILYHDAATPFVSLWFSSCHAPDVETFNALLRPANQDGLEREGGISVVSTHAAAGFVRNGEVHPETRRLLEQLAARPGWFVPVATLLDHLRTIGLGSTIPWAERRVVELRWLHAAARRGPWAVKA